MANGSKENLPAKEDFQLLGDEWSTRNDLEQVIDEFIMPYLQPEDLACEIGCGGGRVAARVSKSVE